MSDTDTTQSETAKTEELKNNGSNGSAQQGNAIDPAEVERFRKEAEQARMRANQLENELKERRDADEVAKRKQLEANDEWKKIAEQNEARANELEEQIEGEKRQKELRTATREVFADFPEEVVEIAKETGLGVNDATDEAKKALKEKLERIASRVSKDKQVTPNNPQAPASAGQNELLDRMRRGDKDARYQAISNLESVKAMRRLSGYSEPS